MSRDPIIIKSPREIEIMRKAGKITAGARSVARAAIADGLTTKQIDKAVNEFIVKSRAIGKRVIRNGDIVSVDVGATFGGYVGDCAGTYPCGEISDEAKRLIEVTRQSFFEGIKFAKSGYRISDIGAAIQEYVEGRGYSVIRDYVGHGVGHEMHEAPEVPNYDIKGLRPNPRLVPGMTIAIEPMVAVGDFHVKVLGNDWTVVTVDGSLAAHYENTICITDGEPEILTMAENID